MIDKITLTNDEIVSIPEKDIICFSKDKQRIFYFVDKTILCIRVSDIKDIQFIEEN